MSKLSVIIPAYNESAGIAQVVRRLAAVRADLQRKAGIAELEVIVVDDGSTDGTGGIVSQVAADIADSRVSVRLIPHGRNLGYGAALQTGFAAARGSYLAFLDADSTYPPEELPGLCRKLRRSGAALVLGDRMRSTVSQMPAVRRVGNTVLAMLATILSGSCVHDCCSGMRVLPAATWQQIKPLPNGLDFTPAMTMRMLHRRLLVQEAIIPYHERVGRSKLRLAQDGVRFLGTILREARMGEPKRLYMVTAPVVFSLLALAALGALTAMHQVDWPHLVPTVRIAASAVAIIVLAAGLALSPWLRLKSFHRLVLRLIVPNGGSAAPAQEEQRGV